MKIPLAVRQSWTGERISGPSDRMARSAVDADATQANLNGQLPLRIVIHGTVAGYRRRTRVRAGAPGGRPRAVPRSEGGAFRGDGRSPRAAARHRPIVTRQTASHRTGTVSRSICRSVGSLRGSRRATRAPVALLLSSRCAVDLRGRREPRSAGGPTRSAARATNRRVVRPGGRSRSPRGRGC
jgi:hypothetical protein